MLLTYINDNGHLKTMQSFYDELNNMHLFDISTDNFIVSLLHRGQHVNYLGLTPLEQYYCSQPVVTTQINPIEFSPSGRIITISETELLNYCPCNFETLPNEPQTQILQKFRVWSDMVGGSSGFTSMEIKTDQDIQLLQFDTDMGGDFEINFSSLDIDNNEIIQFIAWGDQNMLNGDLAYQFTIQDVIDLNQQNIDIVISSGR